MLPDDTANPESVGTRLAAYFCAQRDEIIGEWLGRVRNDPAIPTETLTTKALKDHLPRLFDDLAATLRLYGSLAVAEQSGKDAERHAVTRWEQGYKLPELLREIKHLRTVLIYHMRVFEELHSDYGIVARLFAASTIHGFLDDLAIDATELFTAVDEAHK